MSVARPICIAGAGSIGCFVGGVLAAGGRNVSLLARSRIIDHVTAHGLRVTSVDGLDRHLEPDQFALSDDPAMLAGAGTILVAVKNGDTAAMAGLIARYAPEDAVIVSLQNGVGNVAMLREQLPRHRVLGGMVPFNVVAKSESHVHRATSGDICIERDMAETARALSVPHLAIRAIDNITDLQWGKLLVNLNNALNALSDIPLRSQLERREWRLLFADQMAEGLAVLQAAGIRPVSATPIPAGMTPHLLRLPDVLFRIVLSRAMKIDSDARSSMWEDLQRGRRTEIDYLQGEILQLAARYKVQTPLIERVMTLVKAAEAACQGSPALSSAQIRN